MEACIPFVLSVLQFSSIPYFESSTIRISGKEIGLISIYHCQEILSEVGISHNLSIVCLPSLNGFFSLHTLLHNQK